MPPDTVCSRLCPPVTVSGCSNDRSDNLLDLETARKIIACGLAQQAAVAAKTTLAERYYAVKNDILYQPTSMREAGEKNPMRLADNRIPFGFYNLLVNQKASYLFTSPPIFDTGDDALDERIADALGDSFAKKCKRLCVDASNAGIAWLHYWVDDKQAFRYGVVSPAQIVPIWSDDIDPRLGMVLRAYTRTQDNGDLVDVYEIWDSKECSRWVKLSAAALDDLAAAADFEDFFSLGLSDAANTMLHQYGRPPFVAFRNNDM